MIQVKQFSDFVRKVFSFAEDERLWDFYLHKVNGQSFDDFKDSVKNSQEITEPVNLEATINDSYDILQAFVLEP